MPAQPTHTVPPEGAANETRPYEGEAVPLPASPTDRYYLRAPIARGGMGEVFAAHDRALNREVAVKVLRADLRDRPAIAARFVEEARITGQLQHPNIPPIHDLGTLPDGRPFIAMKLIKGETLADLLAHARPGPSALVAIFEQVCQAVAFAHERAVIHRDLKPGNVMVGKFNEVQVMDWGLAKVLGGGAAPELPAATEPAAPVSVIQTDRDGSSLTQAGSLLGTPAYMPPEQAKGDIARTGARSDVFALGAVLCELLTGEPPYLAASSAEVQALALTAQLAPAFERLRACGGDPELVALAERCLSPKQDDRPANAGEVAKAVADHRAGVAERLRVTDLARARAEEKRKRARVQLALAGAVGLLLAAGGAFAWHSDRQAEQRKGERDREAARTREAVTAALNEAEAALRADDMSLADPALARAKERLGDGGPDDLRQRLADLARDRDMIERLEFLTAEQRTGSHGGFTAGNSSTTYFDTFRHYGLDLDAGDPAAMAERVNRSPIRAQLLAGLYAAFGRESAYRAYRSAAVLIDLLRRVDNDPVRNAIRDAIVARDGPRLRKLVRELDPARLTPDFVVLLCGEGLSRSEQLRVLTAAWERHPGSFVLSQQLYFYYSGGGDTPGALGYARLLVALRPASPLAYGFLALALESAKQYDEAIAAYKRHAALRAGPSWVVLRYEIGRLIEWRSGWDAAHDYYRAEVAAAPDDAESHGAFGLALYDKGRYDGALAHLRRAIELDPTNPRFAHGARMCLERQGDLDGALELWRAVRGTIRSRTWYTLGALPELLLRQNKYTEALRACERAGAESPWWRWILVGRWRTTTALAAALAGTAGGIDPAPAAEWPGLRRKALALLRDEVAILRAEYAFNPAYREFVFDRLSGLLTEPRFARVRGPLYLAALPPDEAHDWLALWDGVRRFRDQTATPVAPPPRPVNP